MGLSDVNVIGGLGAGPLPLSGLGATNDRRPTITPVLGNVVNIAQGENEAD